ncbi:glycerol-3-phosphate dehydrogenase/oxidase [Sinimarinibacterium sp. CAU 1509]|uniref:glycerol-3-phosphate dehydrogenase/oxidase n=1 Tax=Sinimarinibacterium sp. CAU 1509 TaxID=2562283 RepID=UPI0010AC6434|nr:glycerol-3-phosphate dehydrogenase/oxidase [Sinimarinibacterium sp. CAU 1509]TJY65051.1 glycerol-3-phosphate dehydrogenase/oxidase [Sinimarinibacterium sp. CAU 1509]
MKAFPFKRDIAALRDGSFDVLIIGGGIYGAWTAYDAASRGLSVALVEKTDWGAGTSSASSKLIHGGLRYLENYEFGLVRHSLKERRTLFRIAPHLVRPLNFVLPMWKSARVGPLMISAGLTLYDVLAIGNQPVPPHRRFRQRELLTRYPFLDAKDLVSGFRYGDCQEDDARMTLTVAAAAQAHGAVCVNRVGAERMLEQDGRVCGAVLNDVASNSSFEVRARVVVNCTGPWASTLIGAAAPKVKLIKGSHLVLPAIEGCKEAFLLTADDGRVFFVIPWYGHTLVGTTEEEVKQASDAQPSTEEIRYLLDNVRRSLPGLGWTEADVIGSFAGVRMLQNAQNSSLSALSREFEVVQPRPGLLMHVGGKYTTARSDSIEIVDAVYHELGMKPPASVTHLHALPGAPDVLFESWQPQAIASLVAAGVDAEAARWISLRHGTGIDTLLRLIAERPELAQRIHPAATFVAAEAVHAVRNEMAGTIDDVARRRMPLSLLVADQQWLPKLRELLQGELEVNDAAVRQ